MGYKYLGLVFLTIALLQACNFPKVELEKDELIKLQDFANDEIDNYEVTYSYTINDSPIATNFTIQSKFDLLVLKLGKYDSKIKIKYSKGDVFSRFYGFSTEITASYYHTNYYYNSPIDAHVSQLNFTTNNDIHVTYENDSIKSFHTNFREFAVLLNDRSDSGIRAKSWDYGPDTRDADFIIYKKNGSLYLLILTSLKQGETVPENFLLDYLYIKQLPHQKPQDLNLEVIN